MTWVDNLHANVMSEPSMSDQEIGDAVLDAICGEFPDFNMEDVECYEYYLDIYNDLRDKYRYTLDDQTEKGIANAKVEIPVFAREKLREQAIEHHNSLGYDDRASASCAAEFLERLEVNYLRHVYTEYDMVVNDRHARGSDRRHALIKNTILTAIEEAYPDLCEECEDQRVAESPEELRWSGLSRRWNR